MPPCHDAAPDKSNWLIGLDIHKHNASLAPEWIGYRAEQYYDQEVTSRESVRDSLNREFAKRRAEKINADGSNATAESHL